MKLTETELAGVYIIEPAVFGDHRGFFMESWSQRDFEAAGLEYRFVQDNHSSSTVRGTLRGIHFQRGERPRQSWYGVPEARCWTWQWICGPAALPIKNG